MPPGEKITTSEANRRLTEKLPRVVDDFVQIMGQTLRTNLDEYGAVTEADAEMRVQAGRDKERIYREAHPYIRSLALRLTTGKRLSDTQRRTVMSHITRSLESGATVYRELYTSLTGDKEFASYAENEVEDEGVKGEAQKAARNADGLTAFQRSKLAEKIIDKDIGRRIKTKTAVNGEIADYVERRNEEIKELEKTIDTLKENLEETREKLGEEKGESSRWYRQYQKLEKECAAAERKLKGIEKKLAASRQSRVNQAEKMRAGRKAAEDKMRERLAVQRELVKGLRARMREETQHARLQGRMEIGWKWAEERQKLAALSVERQKRIADRKAAAAYLDACKKASSWIMSSDRIAMNIWVRQRELLLGIQNALFESSKKTAEKRNLAAQIKDVEKKIEKEKRRLTRAKDDASRGAIERNISEYEAFLENLQSSLEYTEVLSPDVSGVKTNQKGEGESEDTVDTGVIVFNGKTMSVEEFREQFYEHKIRYGFMDSKMRAALRGSAPSARTLGEKRKWSAINLARGMSLSDLETVKAVMKQLAIEGRANWERREFAIHFQHREMIQTLLQAQDELRHDKKKTRPIKRLMKALEEKNIEERKKLLSEGHEVERALYGGWDDKRLLQHMDGDRKRALYRFVIRERIKYANRRDIAIEERTKRIMELLGGTEKNEKKHWNV